MREILKKLGSKINYAILAMVLTIAIGIITLFVRPCVGMADNGDFYRIISQNGIYHLSKDKNDIFLGYFNKYYGIYKYNNENQKMLISTESLIVKAAVALDRLLTKDYIFDIGFLAIIYLIIHGLGAYFIVKVFTYDLKTDLYKFIITIVFVVIFSDTAYLAYYNSFFGEAVNLSCFLLSIGILLNMYKIKKVNIFSIMCFAVVSFIFLGSKQQLSPIGILISIIFIRLYFISRDKILKGICCNMAIIFIVSSIYFFANTKGDYEYMNRYHAITRGVLLNEGNPEEILKKFNINEQYGMLQGEIFFKDVPIIDPYSEKVKKEFYDKYSTFSILNFYLKNPSILNKVIDISFDNAYSIRPKAMGNYEKVEGNPFGKKSNFFSLWSNLKEVTPHGTFLSIIYIGFYFWGSIKNYRKGFSERDYSLILIEEGMFYVFLVGIFQILISVIGAGDADLSKHEFMYNVSFDLMFIYFLCNIFKDKENKSHSNK